MRHHRTCNKVHPRKTPTPTHHSLSTTHDTTLYYFTKEKGCHFYLLLIRFAVYQKIRVVTSDPGKGILLPQAVEFPLLAEKQQHSIQVGCMFPWFFVWFEETFIIQIAWEQGGDNSSSPDIYWSGLCCQVWRFIKCSTAT